MRRLVAIALALAACRCAAADPSLLMRTRTDPSRMRLSRGGRVQLLVAFMAGGEKAVTAVAWTRVRPQQARYLTSFQTFWSMDASRSTREGGPALAAIREYAPAAPTSGGVFANPLYDDRGLGDRWAYGCYAVNIQTDVPLTLTLAGTERQIAASNGVRQAFNMLGSAADWTWSLAGAAEGNVLFGFAANPLVRYYGMMQHVNSRFDVVQQAGAVRHDGITNEWAMCVCRVRFDAGSAIESDAVFTWDAEAFAEAETTNATSRAAFARDARVALLLWSSCATNVIVDVERYGEKVFPRWLSDDELRRVRDLDMFEMKRRGMSRWRSE